MGSRGPSERGQVKTTAAGWGETAPGRREAPFAHAEKRAVSKEERSRPPPIARGPRRAGQREAALLAQPASFTWQSLLQ